MDVDARQHMGTYQVVRTIKVPVCRNCKRTVERIPMVVWGLAALVVVAISAGGGGWGDRDVGMVLKILVGGVIGFSLGALPAYFAGKLCAPAKLSFEGRLEFYNEIYQKLYEGRLSLEAGIALHELSRSPACRRCGQVYPSHHHLKLLVTAEGFDSLCNSCYDKLGESEKRAIGYPVSS